MNLNIRLSDLAYICSTEWPDSIAWCKLEWTSRDCNPTLEKWSWCEPSDIKGEMMLGLFLEYYPDTQRLVILMPVHVGVSSKTKYKILLDDFDPISLFRQFMWVTPLQYAVLVWLPLKWHSKISCFL